MLVLMDRCYRVQEECEPRHDAGHDEDRCGAPKTLPAHIFLFIPILDLGYSGLTPAYLQVMSRRPMIAITKSRNGTPSPPECACAASAVSAQPFLHLRPSHLF